jgi:hypothetical protein
MKLSRYERSTNDEEANKHANDVDVATRLVDKSAHRSPVKSVLVHHQSNRNRKENIFDSKYIKSLNDLNRMGRLIVRELSESPRSSFLKSQHDFMRTKSELCLKQAAIATRSANRHNTAPVNNNRHVHKMESKSSKKKRSNASKTPIVVNYADNLLPVVKAKLNHSQQVDIDHEDDIIFNDEDDSISSTVFTVSNPKLDYMSTKSLNTLRFNTRPQQSLHSLNFPIHQNHDQQRDLSGSGSISDMDPDENIIKDLLVKSNPKINNRY